MTLPIKMTHERSTFKPFNYPWMFDAWLEHEQHHWLHTELPFHDDVVDFQKRLPEDKKRFLTHLFRFFTQGDCYSSDTEVLTDKGWVMFPELTYAHKVAQVKYIEGNFISQFVTPSRIICKPYEGKLHILEDSRQRTRQVVTPNHDIVYTYHGSLKKEPLESARIYQHKKFHTSAFKYSDKVLLTPMERLMIAFQADGNVKPDVKGSRLGFIPHRFTFKKARKINRLTEILEDCAAFGITYEVTQELREDGINTTFYVKGLQEPLSKAFSWVDLEAISSEWGRAFLEELVHWDGYQSPDGRYYYYNTNKVAADTCHSISTLAGISVAYYKKLDDRSEKFSDVYVLSWTPGENTPVDGQAISRNRSTIDYIGNVYCVTVPSGMFITRNNLKVAISGNCDVAGAYVKNYLPVFSQPEVRMMLLGFAAREAVHIAAYSHLVETLGMPETIYNEFLKYEAMRNKHEYVMDFIGKDRKTIAQQIAVFSMFTEGMQLFSSFVLLLNFTRNGYMKSMGQIITWSMADEDMHVRGMINLFRTFITENMDIWTDELKAEIYKIATKMVELEDAFIDLAYETCPDMWGLTKEDVKLHIRFIADRNLIMAGMKPIFGQKTTPLTWVDEMVGIPTHTNFFENKSVDYTKGALTGSWGDVWAQQ